MFATVRVRRATWEITGAEYCPVSVYRRQVFGNDITSKERLLQKTTLVEKPSREKTKVGNSYNVRGLVNILNGTSCTYCGLKPPRSMFPFDLGWRDSVRFSRPSGIWRCTVPKKQCLPQPTSYLGSIAPSMPWTPWQHRCYCCFSRRS